MGPPIGEKVARSRTARARQYPRSAHAVNRVPRAQWVSYSTQVGGNGLFTAEGAEDAEDRRGGMGPVAP